MLSSMNLSAHSKNKVNYYKDFGEIIKVVNCKGFVNLPENGMKLFFSGKDLLYSRELRDSCLKS